MSANPFTLSFGKNHCNISPVSRKQTKFWKAFVPRFHPIRSTLITGVRGSGKTVMMTNIASELRKERRLDRCGTESYQRFTAKSCCKIYSIPELHTLFINAKLDFSAFGLGVSIENAAPVTDIENALELMLKYIQKSEKGC